MTIDLAKLRATAQAATQPSPWIVVVDDHGRAVVIDANDMWVADVGAAPADAEHIAAASPSVVLELTAEIERLRKLIGDTKFYLDRQDFRFGDGSVMSMWQNINEALRERIDAAIPTEARP